MKPTTKPKVTGAKRTGPAAGTTATGAGRTTGTASKLLLNANSQKAVPKRTSLRNCSFVARLLTTTTRQKMSAER
jgi:hypothetical protein